MVISKRRVGMLFLACIAASGVFSCTMPTKIADEIARGDDEISAVINGQRMTFKVIGAGNYFGIHTSGKSGTNTIGLNLGYGSIGTVKWTYRHDFMDSSPAATWNDAYALKDVGYLTVLRHDTQIEFISGKFEFTTVDPMTKDTTRVTDGKFQIHYITTD